MKTDEQLWDDFQAGGQSALGELDARYRDLLNEYVAMKGLDPSDITQEALIAFAGQPRNGRTFRPFIIAIVNELIRDQKKANRREAGRLASPEMEVLAEAFQQ